MLMRFDPFRELDRLSQESWGAQRRPSSIPIDAYRKGDRFFVHFDLPGVDAANIELTVEKNVLTVRAERSWQWEEGTELVVSERPQGVFTRQLFLGETLDTGRIDANYDHGVLTIIIPVAEAAKPRKVQIGQRGDRPTAIDAESAPA